MYNSFQLHMQTRAAVSCTSSSVLSFEEDDINEDAVKQLVFVTSHQLKILQVHPLILCNKPVFICQVTSVGKVVIAISVLDTFVELKR